LHLKTQYLQEERVGLTDCRSCIGPIETMRISRSLTMEKNHWQSQNRANQFFNKSIKKAIAKQFFVFRQNSVVNKKLSI
jgi:hypothetical protein